MKLKGEIRFYIFQSVNRSILYESGGILGAKQDTIDHVAFDKGIQNTRCSYTPNINYINQVIEVWQRKRIQFMGMFHTHFFGVETLSQGDIEYIKSILSAMPNEIAKLYFPIILPEYKRIIPYIAERDSNGIKINKDKLEIIDDSL